jgi:hypothetical protein
MAADFLAHVAQQKLPMRVETPYAVDCAFILQAAGLVDAELSNEGGQGYGYAVIRSVTHEGRAALKRRNEGGCCVSWRGKPCLSSSQTRDNRQAAALA